MARMKLLGGDLSPGTEFYNNPGSIREQPVVAIYATNPEALEKAGIRKSFSIGTKVRFIAELDDGKRVLVETDPRTYNRLINDIADGPVSADAIEDRSKENKRMGLVFLGVFFLASVVFGQYLTGTLPFLAAFGVAVVAGIVSRGICK